MSLRAAYERLNEEQRAAVDHAGCTVVLAGPGSGKTDTLAVKAARLLALEIRPPQGVACITYTRAAAAEIRDRVAGLGVRLDRRLFAGTVHAFCRHVVLRTGAELAGRPDLRDPEIARPSAALNVLQAAMDDAGVWGRASSFQPRLSSIRSADAVGQALEQHFDDRDVTAMRRYEARLREEGLIDFDGLIQEAVRMVRETPRVADLVASAFPWILVDEYQDLGGILHALVQELRHAGVSVFAVGDPDQTVMQFTGANPAFLEELADSDCRSVRLRRNYRSGSDLVAAAAVALGQDRGYEAVPGREDPGRVVPTCVEGGIEAQAVHIVREVLPAALKRTRPEEIAILYPQRGAALTALRSALDDSGVPYSFERDERFDMTGEVGSWLQRVAQYSLRQETVKPLRLRDLADELAGLIGDGYGPVGRASLAAAERLDAALATPPEGSVLLLDWVNDLVEALDLETKLEHVGGGASEIEALDTLRKRLGSSAAGTTLQEFAGPLRQPGRVVVTTYHSSKGRQFDIVILPFLQEMFMPPAFKKQERWIVRDADDARLRFYVAFTRARHEVALIYSPRSGMDPYGDPAAFGPSRFVLEHLDD
jgi:DNA helicase II / ATP-dependent DNA helicase PcrA